MHTVRHSVYTAPISCSLVLLGCASSGSRDMDSDETLLLRGSIVLPQGRSDERPVPALLLSDGLAHLHLQEVTLQGHFPTDIQLELREPPPERALYSIGALDEPKVATGFLTMVPASHPDDMRYTTVTTRDVICDGDCEITERWCADDLDCYEEARVCPDETVVPGCTLRAVGDEALKQPPPWDLFAGVSDNYVFAYLSAPLPAGSVTAALFGSPAGMSAGYHVLEAGHVVGSAFSALDDCWHDAVDDALARVNAEDLTEYTWVDLLRPCADEHSWTSLEGPLCKLPLSERQTLRTRFEAATWRARLERGCALSYRELRPADLTPPLTIRLLPAPAANSVLLF